MPRIAPPLVNLVGATTKVTSWAEFVYLSDLWVIRDWRCRRVQWGIIIKIDFPRLGIGTQTRQMNAAQTHPGSIVDALLRCTAL